MTAQPNSFDEAMDALGTAWVSSSAEERGKILVTLYQEYSKRFLLDGTRIWTIAATLVPLSLGSFALLASIDKPTIGQIILLSLAGWLLMSLWLVIAENHRAFQNASVEWLRAIEKRWGFDDVPDRKPGRGFLVRPGMVRRIRFVLWWIVTLGTVAAILFWPGGIFA